MSEHTPGPYAAKDGMVYAESGDGRTLAQVYGCTDDEMDANARLFAAAPDLLEACIAIADVFGIPADGCEDNPHAIQVRDAISKATGSQVSA